MRLVQGIYILLGSNLGNRFENLQQARHRVHTLAGTVLRASSLYESEAWGETQQPDFLNQVLEIAPRLSHEALLQTLQSIEKQMGKHKIGKWRERLIDLDILYYGNRIVRTHELTLPHPQIQYRNFTLLPLCELAAEACHPLLLKSHQQLLTESQDPLKAWKVADSAVAGT